jgi:O-antigen/teichoic acid export membrane protein
MVTDRGKSTFLESLQDKIPFFASYRLGALAKSSMAVMMWSGARLLAQLLWVLLLARALGASNYGLFSGVAALALAMSGFVGMGLGLRMYQDAARDPALFLQRWEQASRVLVWSGICLAVLYLAIACKMFDASWSLLVAVALSELVLAPVVALVAFGYAAHGRMGHAAAAPVMLSMARILAVIVLFLLPGKGGIGVYAWLHVAATGVTAMILRVRCAQRLKIVRAKSALDWRDARSGLGFSAIQASGLALTSMDKAFALRWGGDALAGHYVAAYRFVSTAALPVDSLMMAALPHLFRAGSERRGTDRMLIMLAAATGGYGVIMGALVWCTAGLVPWLLGSSFHEASSAVRMLAIYVPLYCIRTLGTNILLGFGWKRWRFCCEITALCVMAGSAAWRIPLVGLAGAVEALLAGEMVLVVLVWIGCFGARRSKYGEPREQ